MKNIFDFYTGQECDKENKKATREIIKEIEKFRIKLEKIMKKYKHIGASDTQSREEIVNYLKKQIDKGGFI